MAAVVGYVTDRDGAICLSCAQVSDHTLGALLEPIEDPAPNGLWVQSAKNKHRYAAPCDGCGWAIRREPTMAQ